MNKIIITDVIVTLQTGKDNNVIFRQKTNETINESELNRFRENKINDFVGDVNVFFIYKQNID